MTFCCKATLDGVSRARKILPECKGDLNLKGVHLFAWLPVWLWQRIMLEDLWSRDWAKLFRNYGNIVIVAKEIPEGFDNEDWEAQLNESGFLHVSRWPYLFMPSLGFSERHSGGLCVWSAVLGVVIIESGRTNGGEEQNRGTFFFWFVMLLQLLQLETSLAWYRLHSRDISGTGR